MIIEIFLKALNLIQRKEKNWYCCYDTIELNYHRQQEKLSYGNLGFSYKIIEFKFVKLKEKDA